MHKFIICFCLILILLLIGNRQLLSRFVFFPSARLESTPAALKLSFQDITLTTADNVRLHGWYIPASYVRATVLFFHGNGGNMSHCLDTIKIFNDLGLNVFIISYRGYGQSGGRPSIKGVNIDALTAWQWLSGELKVPAENIVVFGRSLGGAVAMELMKSTIPGALILESTFSSVADMSPFPARIAPFLMGGDFWNSAKTAVSLRIPTLCIHSPTDNVVPFRQGKRVYEALGSESGFSEKTILEIHGDHNSGFMESLDLYIPALESFLTKHFGERTAISPN